MREALGIFNVIEKKQLGWNGRLWSVWGSILSMGRCREVNTSIGKYKGIAITKEKKIKNKPNVRENNKGIMAYTW